MSPSATSNDRRNEETDHPFQVVMVELQRDSEKEKIEPLAEEKISFNHSLRSASEKVTTKHL